MGSMDATRTLTEPWSLGRLRVPNRLLLAPLAGIGNWFVRLQAKRYGAGLAVSEMISSFAIHYGNEKTLTELNAIAALARIGLSRMPKTGYSAPAATGMPITL